MTSSTAGRRYARVLFDVALAEKADIEAVEREVAGFADLMTQHSTLEKVLLNPAVSAARKRAVVAALVGAFSPIVKKLLLLLAERDRLVILPPLLAAYRERLLDHQKVVRRVEVTTAGPLGAAQAAAIEGSLARASGRTVLLATRIDPSIIGGLVARVGGTVYDGSITRQLEKMKQRLVERV